MNNSDLSIEGKSICEDTDNLIKDSTVNIENDQEFLGWTPYEKFKQNIKKSCKLMIRLYLSVKRRIFGRKKLGRVILIVILLVTLWKLWSITSLPPNDVSQRKIFIAANFYNNEDILPNFSEQLLELVQILGPENVYISIFENGSKDNTKLFLQTLQSTLNSIDIANTIIIDDTPKYYIGRRIPYLANLRNRVLEPLLEQAEKENHFDKVLFFNDIIWKVSDILTLLRTNGYSYDAACAMDFYWTFYDTFATRELPSPNISYPWPPTPYYPFFYDTTAQQQIYNGESVQVFSCWNGVVIMNAEPFVKHGIKFRALMPQDKELPFEASECCLIFSDFKKVGYDKVFINPNVKVSYVYRFYLWSNYFLSLIDRFFFRYFNHPTPPSLFSYEGIRMQEVMKDAVRFNVTKLDRICVQ
ncbi:uncharacterized protein OCT59_017999 [Rhizophagus irregularis]|nr:hypothetical protein RirG_042350 [Rhizophagus irregularis DAOM 197198w]UZO25738.1 hypothetical protein OCT59_017999 [Rhizophagus irregularis]CAB4475961.1 unnamed protein product [Rhizophagus irregularis]